MYWKRLGATFAAGVLAAQSPLGIFEGHTDVGTVLHAGTAEYDPATRAYTLSGSGDNMWAAADAFHFAWKKASGDVTITADAAILGTSGDAHRKAVLMIRQSLDTDSAYVDGALHGSGLTSLQNREFKGGPSFEIQSNVNAPRHLRLTKRGNDFFLSVATEGGDFRFSGGSLKVVMSEPFYVGIGVCAHNKDNVEKAVFTNLQIATPSAAPVAYSTIETAPVPTGDRRAAYTSAGHIAAPMWSTDGAAIFFERAGRMWHVASTGDPGEAVGAGPPPAPAGEQRNGEHIYYSAERGGVMAVLRKPAAGGEEETLTSGEYSAWFPQVSPDGQRVAFLSADRSLKDPPVNQEVTLRILTLADKTVRASAKFIGGKGSLDGGPWSPDGRRVAYVSYQVVPGENAAKR